MTTDALGPIGTASTAAPETEYDRVLYPGGCHPESWPDHVAAIAILLGLDAPPTDACRVLEVGCGEGANLIPMALTMPNARLVGIDAAERPVEQARGRAMAVGLDNVEFRRLNLAEAGPDLGQFDYIIAHGVYSWVPPAVRERLLALCKSNLAPNGVAYVSYNAMPGGAVRQMARQIARYHLAQRGVTDPTAQVAEARALLQMLGQTTFVAPFEWAGYRQVMREESQLVAETDESVVYHDTLAETNDAFWFHEFAAAAGRHGLQFLGEANVTDLFNAYFPPQVRQSMESLPPGDAVAREQYADFLKGRTFRRTLLCHAGLPLDRPPGAVRVRSLYAGSRARTDPPLGGGVQALHELVRNPATPLRFFRGPGATASTQDPLAKAAMVHLIGNWPNFVAFDELLAGARRHSGVGDASAPPAPAGTLGDAGARGVAELLLGAYAAKLVDLRARPPRLTARVSDRPVASPIARLQAAAGPDVSLTSLLGENLRPPADSVGRRLLPLLDGSRDRAALLDELVALARTGDAEILDNGVRVEDPDRIRALFRPELERQLRELAVNALLMA